MSDTLSRLRKIITEHLGVDEAKVVQGASFFDALGADSLDMLELVQGFEAAFDIEITNDQSNAMLTVADAVASVEMQLAAKHRGAH